MMNTMITKQAVVSTQTKVNPTQIAEKFVLFDEDGQPFSFDAQDGSDVILTGYASHAVGDVSATDSVNVAIAKLEARVAALETALAAHLAG